MGACIDWTHRFTVIPQRTLVLNLTPRKLMGNIQVIQAQYSRMSQDCRRASSNYLPDVKGRDFEESRAIADSLYAHAWRQGNPIPSQHVQSNPSIILIADWLLLKTITSGIVSDFALRTFEVSGFDLKRDPFVFAEDIVSNSAVVSDEMLATALFDVKTFLWILFVKKFGCLRDRRDMLRR